MSKGALISRGRTADVYAWGQDSILKLFQPRFPAAVIEREFMVTNAARAAGIKAPAAEKIVEDDGRLGIVFERLRGPSMLQMISARPLKILAYARQLADLHWQIHQAVVPPDFPAQMKQIEYGIDAGADLPAAARQAALARLAALPRGDFLCHGDFHPDNILFTSEGPFIIDWMTGTRGSSLGDVCRSSLIFQTTALPPHTPRLAAALFGLLRKIIDSIYFNHYLELSGARREEIDAWMLPLMAARLREVEAFPKEKALLLQRIDLAVRNAR